MVSQRRRGSKGPKAHSRPPAGQTRERLLVAAREEFAARGFDGAKVDRIARRARINKAMVYYHFPSKAALYLAILLEQFAAVAAAVSEARAKGGAPVEQLGRYIDTIAHVALARPHFPPMWLREIAEGGRHLDESVLGELRRVLETLAAILKDGKDQGAFRPAHPFVTQMGIMAPLMFFAASAPVRLRVGKKLPPALALPDLEGVVAYVKASTLAVLSVARAAPGSRRTSS
ncbi:MAG TPA: TetR/AcrR family transcriptional regulator [Vicinamibacterales bacterium]|nr:TetR/AcrR family transcriptional regulator [Vicinamibacterales bacterium]